MTVSMGEACRDTEGGLESSLGMSAATTQDMQWSPPGNQGRVWSQEEEYSRK